MFLILFGDVIVRFVNTEIVLRNAVLFIVHTHVVLSVYAKPVKDTSTIRLRLRAAMHLVVSPRPKVAKLRSETVFDWL